MRRRRSASPGRRQAAAGRRPATTERARVAHAAVGPTMRVARVRIAVLLLGSLALASCAHALKKPPPLSSVTGEAGGHSAQDVGALLARAEALFARRELPPVKQAAETWLTAAAADRARVEGLIGAARAHVWLTEHEAEPAARLAAATRAVHEAQWCGRLAPSAPACAYWLGAALGVQARERPATGLSALPKIVAAFKAAAAASPALEEAGPERALALVYLRAPAWPAGPGDPELALEHARRAVSLKPDYPPNQLVLGEALAATGDAAGRRAAYERARELARARAEAGDPEAREWSAEAQKNLPPNLDDRDGRGARDS